MKRELVFYLSLSIYIYTHIYSWSISAKPLHANMTPTPHIPLLDCKVLCRSRSHKTGMTVVQHRKSFNCFPQSRKKGCLLDWRLEVHGTQKSLENFLQFSQHLTENLFFKTSRLPNRWQSTVPLLKEHLYFKLREKVTRIKDHWKWTSLLCKQPEE